MAKAAAINAERQRPLSWKAVIKRVLVVAVGGLAIYLVLPRLASVLGSTRTPPSAALPRSPCSA